MQITTRLSKLIEAALVGDEVILTKDGKPVAKIVAFERKGYQLGALEGQVPPPPDDFFDALDEATLREWE